MPVTGRPRALESEAAGTVGMLGPRASTPGCRAMEENEPETRTHLSGPADLVGADFGPQGICDNVWGLFCRHD